MVTIVYVSTEYIYLTETHHDNIVIKWWKSGITFSYHGLSLVMLKSMILLFCDWIYRCYFSNKLKKGF